MEKTSKRIRKIPVRSTMSDEELLALIKKDKEERPWEFEASPPKDT